MVVNSKPNTDAVIARQQKRILEAKRAANATPVVILNAKTFKQSVIDAGRQVSFRILTKMVAAAPKRRPLKEYQNFDEDDSFMCTALRFLISKIIINFKVF